METNFESNYEKVGGMLDEFKTVSILRNLIRIPSYTGEEKAKADYVAKEMERTGLEVIETYIDFENGRRNVPPVVIDDGAAAGILNGDDSERVAQKRTAARLVPGRAHVAGDEVGGEPFRC